jgi:biopolymer transport protein ExbD
MARRSILERDEETKIDLAPMIDCVFILLIFFIVTTVFVEEQGLQVSKPDAAAAASPEEKNNVAIDINAAGKILYQGKEIALADVTSVVKANLDDPETPVVIRASEKSSHGTFIGVWDAAKRGGARALSFSTVN